jgi:hypothetical protein
LFNQVLKMLGSRKMVYSISVGYRIIFLAIAGVIIGSISFFGVGSLFERINIGTLVIVLICLFAALYQERWIFDKNSNRFEKNFGIAFFYSRRRYPLDTLAKVVLQEPGLKYKEKPTLIRWVSPRSAILSIVDRNGTVYRLDMAKGGSARELRQFAERLSEFCGVPLENHLGDL